jgi:hypothetical protein
MKMRRRKFASLYIPALAISLLLLYSALAGVQSSTAEMMPAEMKLAAVESVDQQALAAAGQVLKERLSAHLQEDIQLTLSLEDNHLIVSLPPSVEPYLLLAEASRIGYVELVDGGTEFLAVGALVTSGPQAIPDQDTYQAVLTSADFETAQAEVTQQGRPVIHFSLTPGGDARLATHTAALRGYYLCLVVDGRVTNCPILRTPLKNRTGNIELTGDATLEDARALAVLLRSGPLPVRLEINRD